MLIEEKIVDEINQTVAEMNYGGAITRIPISINSPNVQIGPHVLENGESMKIIRSFYEVEKCPARFALEVALQADGFIDVVFGILPAADRPLVLTQLMKDHFNIKLRHESFTCDDLLVLDIEEYQNSQKKLYLQPLDWAWAMKLQTITNLEVLWCLDEDEMIDADYLDTESIGNVIHEFIRAFHHLITESKGGSSR